MRLSADIRLHRVIHVTRIYGLGARKTVQKGTAVNLLRFRFFMFLSDAYSFNLSVDAGSEKYRRGCVKHAYVVAYVVPCASS